jgi:hypothetical protein
MYSRAILLGTSWADAMEAQRQLYTLDNDRIAFYWEEIKRLLEEVPGFYDLYSPEWVLSQAKMGHLQIWALSNGKIEAIIITQICVYPRAKVFEILAAAGTGTLKYFDEAEATFEWLARDSGCEFVRTVVRPGLAHKLGRRGVSQGVLLSRRVQLERAN